MTDEELQQMANRLLEAPGVRAVMLGGSRARGDHTPESDYDLGLYYETPLDVAALQALAQELDGPTASLTSPMPGRSVEASCWLTRPAS